MKSYIQDLKSYGWEESLLRSDFSAIRENSDVNLVIARNEKCVDSILIYAHTIGMFENQDDADVYIDVFCKVILAIHKSFPGLAIYYIQNYRGFDPRQYMDYIGEKMNQSPLKEVLEILPLKNQRRVCVEPPKIIKDAMPGIKFSPSIGDALNELGIK